MVAACGGRGRFGVNVLGRQHERFAARATPAGADRFAGLDWEPGRGGAPLLTDALATLECEIVAEHPAGDHWIVVGRVDDLRISPIDRPARLLRRRIRRRAIANAQLRLWLKPPQGAFFCAWYQPGTHTVSVPLVRLAGFLGRNRVHRTHRTPRHDPVHGSSPGLAIAGEGI